MHNLIDEMQYILETDKTIRELVAHEIDELTGVRYLSIAQEEVPEGMASPYICIREESRSGAEGPVDEAVISFDVVAENKLRVVQQIALRVEQLFEHRNLMPYAITSFRDGVYPITTDDPSIHAKNVKIRVRLTREDLLGGEDTWDSNTVVVYATVRQRTSR